MGGRRWGPTEQKARVTLTAAVRFAEPTSTCLWGLGGFGPARTAMSAQVSQITPATTTVQRDETPPTLV